MSVGFETCESYETFERRESYENITTIVKAFNHLAINYWTFHNYWVAIEFSFNFDLQNNMLNIERNRNPNINNQRNGCGLWALARHPQRTRVTTDSQLAHTLHFFIDVYSDFRLLFARIKYKLEIDFITVFLIGFIFLKKWSQKRKCIIKMLLNPILRTICICFALKGIRCSDSRTWRTWAVDRLLELPLETVRNTCIT